MEHYYRITLNYLCTVSFKDINSTLAMFDSPSMPMPRLNSEITIAITANFLDVITDDSTLQEIGDAYMSDFNKVNTVFKAR